MERRGGYLCYADACKRGGGPTSDVHNTLGCYGHAL